MKADTKARFIGLTAVGSIAVWLTLSIGNAFYLSIVSSRWPRVPARVTSSKLNTGSSNIGTWWAPDMEYEYRLNGHEYRSTTVRYLMPPSYKQEEAQTLVTAYPVNTQVNAAYDPQYPAHSVLEPGIPPAMWTKALIPILFWCLTAFLYYEIVRPQRRWMLRSSPEALPQE